MQYVSLYVYGRDYTDTPGVQLRSLVVNSKTGQALHEFDWNDTDDITVTHSGNTWTISNASFGEMMTFTLSSPTAATAVLSGNRNGISGKISGIKMTAGGDINNIHPGPDTDTDTGTGTDPVNPIEHGPMTYVTISVTGVDDSSPKHGLTADGASQLLIKAVTNKDGYVAFRMTDGLGLSLKLDESYASSSKIMKMKASAAGTFESTAILTAPESFPSSFNLPSGSFNIYATFAEDVNDLNTSEMKASQILTLHAAPVVLIHGIFGKSESTFGKGGAGIWGVLEHTGLSLHPWNYYNSNGPNDVIRENQESELSS
ncbi:MAG: hypothetical protein IJ576_05750, partial [Synergistaceae bacterium]|nr:hypothetical protein [Synergistaceae bacterium]